MFLRTYECIRIHREGWTQNLGCLFPDIHARVFEVASKTMRIDIHAKLPKKNAECLRHVIESARPIEPGS